uniref:HTH myb-type domain-containing protein n=1 Tax=Globisporangium ultimum (strain ATCC 200006 / CBS 805.95 / DAOM BR144) TaxID=431595 RepID=K3WNC7_GLOUD
MYPEGPWKLIAERVGTRSARQVQTHAQKYYEKVARRLRGLRKDRKKLVRPEHRLDEDMEKLCKVAVCEENKVPTGPIRRGLSPVLVQPPVSSPSAVDAKTEDIDSSTLHSRERANSCAGSIASQGTEELNDSNCESEEICANDVADSDDPDALSDFDDYCLDYLIDILGPSVWV